MPIAILGWGSLIPEPRALPIAGAWQEDGPLLRVEFSRISKRGDRAGCLTLVIDEHHGGEVRAHYVISSRTDLAQAIADLRERERVAQEDIGFCEVITGQIAPSAMKRHPKSCECIRAWAREKGFDAVVWTALGRRFKNGQAGVPFTPAAALAYVNGLPEPTKQRALEYIRMTPAQTMTPFRRLLLEQSK